ITSSPELLSSFICSGHRDKSCSDHFVRNVASGSIEFAPDCSCIVQCTHFIHDSITLTSSEYDISSDGALRISLSQSSSVRTNPDNVLVLVAVSAFRSYGLRHPMKLVPFANRVRMDVKAFTSRPSVPLLITNSILLWSFICSGHRDKSCSDHFVLNVASVSIEFAPDCSCIVQCTHCIYDSITLTSSEYDISSDGALYVASQTSVIGYVKRAHFIHDSITLTRSEFDVSSDGPLNSRVALVPIQISFIMSSHEARTDANQCSSGVSMAFSSRPGVPLLITNSRYTSQHFVLDSNGLRNQKILVAADATLKLFPMVLMFFLVTHVRNCEDESLILYDLHRITFLLCCDMVYCAFAYHKFTKKEIDIVYDSNEILAADGTQIAFPTVLMFSFATQVRNCEDESRILNDLHRITRERKVLVRSIKNNKDIEDIVE
ncbi:hypothetical protein T07_13457, partial [Trichinella nelsoni]